MGVLNLMAERATRTLKGRGVSIWVTDVGVSVEGPAKSALFKAEDLRKLYWEKRMGEIDRIFGDMAREVRGE
jgi:hypothetical protein